MARAKTARTATKTNGDAASSTNPEVKKTSGKAGNGDSTQHSNVEELIRTRAYELFEQRGRIHGHAHEDWLRAEAEVRGTRGNRTA